MRALPDFARVNRRLRPGPHPFLSLLPRAEESPALRRIAKGSAARARLLAGAQVNVCGARGYAFVDVQRPRIVLSSWYYETGEARDLYLDLLHELTHLRQLGEGFDLWDERFDYVDRPTEVEAYAVAVEEGRRLGMTSDEVREHLSNPWMAAADVDRLLRHIDGFLETGALPNLEAARNGAPFRARFPWRCPQKGTSQARR